MPRFVMVVMLLLSLTLPWICPGLTSSPKWYFGSANEFAHFDVYSPWTKVFSVRNWRQADKEVVLKELEMVSLKNPKIPFKLGKLSLFRTSRIEPKSQRLKAVTVPNAIFLSDRFFSSSPIRQRLTLVHEITHGIDIGSLIAFSREWSGNPGFRDRNGLISMEEDLADTFANYLVLNQSKPNFKPLAEQIIKPDDNRTRSFKVAYTEGLRSYYGKKDDSAIDAFGKASELVPDAPMPHHFLALAFYRKGDWSNALKHASKAESCFERLRTPPNERNLIKTIRVRAYLLIRTQGDYNEASDAVSKLIGISPNEPATKELQRSLLQLRTLSKDK